MAIPSSEGAVRAWLRTLPSVVLLTGQRQFFAMPEKDRPTLPAIVLYRVGGYSDVFQHDYPDIIFECWGADKTKADALGRALVYEINQLEFRRPSRVSIPGDSDALIVGGSVNSGPNPNGGTSWARRYRVDASFQLRSA